MKLLRDHNNVRPFILGIYVFVQIVALASHELWGDELHSWNIARGSGGLLALLQNARYEGHPPLWYVLMWIGSFISQNAITIQVLHFFICLFTAWLIVYRFGVHWLVAALALSGYYLAFEYSVISRNYSLAVLFSLLAIQNYAHQRRYSVFLFLLALSHFLGILLALSIHISRLFIYPEERRKWLLFFLGGALIFISLLYISPPSDSSLPFEFWMKIRGNQQPDYVADISLRAFLPMPNWTWVNFWNSHFIVNGPYFMSFNKRLFASVLIVLIAFVPLLGKSRAWVIFGINLVLNLLFAYYFPVITARYAGFIFIGWLVALLYAFQSQPKVKWHWVGAIVLLAQLPGAVFTLRKDYKHEFSCFNTLEKNLEQVDRKLIITDYWCLNYLTAALQEEAYCIDFAQKKGHLVWNKTFEQITKNKNRYSHGVSEFLRSTKNDTAFLVSNNSPELISKMDTNFTKQLTVEVMLRKEEYIEKYSQLYIYRVSEK